MALFCGIGAAALVSLSDVPAQTPGEKLKKFAEKYAEKRNPFLKGNPKDAPKAAVADDEKPITQEQLAFFEKKIRPVLVDQCYSCHTSETAKGPKGSLTIDTRMGIRAGGDTGPAVVPNDLKASLIIKAMKGETLSQMPPKNKLSDEVVADFEKWIGMGAPDPRSTKTKGEARVIDIEKGREHWAFQPVKAPKSNSTIDSLIQAKLTEQKLTPSGEADKATLVRRVYFDLIGLPPTPEQVEDFVKGKTDLEKLVDQLLASPQFGEKWARHWLDVARYAESSGKEQNQVYPFAWRYRDYVIASFNKDKPYNEFLKEQLAGDLLSSKNDTEKAEKMVATGFLAVGAKSHNQQNRQQFQLDLADEQIDAMGQAMLGMTIACARCHDHKFDPIPTKDYYALAGIFMSTETLFGTASGIQVRQSAPLATLPKDSDLPMGDMMSKAEVERMKTRQADLKTQLEKQREEDRKTPGQGVPIRQLVLIQQIGIVEKQLSYYDAEGAPKKMAMAVTDRTFGRDMPIHIRGEVNKLGDVVPRGFVQVISTGPTKITSRGSGRKELAEWVASEKNPLTARVMANRIWQHLFGQGLVQSPDNFGTTGQAPTHPELLDLLASDFVKNGWSMKKLIREVMLTKTYRQASNFNEANAAIDPDNNFLWRMSKRRLDAEAIRDAMLMVSGQLTMTAPTGSPIQKFEGNAQQIGRPGLGGGMGGPGMGGGGLSNLGQSGRRSVYIPIIRDNVPEALELFDFAEPSLVTGSRDGTSVPSQALYLMNNPQVIRLADSFAEKIARKANTDTEKVNEAFKMAFGRAATDAETKAAKLFIEKFTNAETRSGKRKAEIDKAAWSAFAQALFSAAEFRYLD
jgi:hypothetical protein